MSSPRIPFIDLRSDPNDLELRGAIDRVLERGYFVLGPELEAFETEFAAASGAAHAVGVASGTDAITLALRAAGIGPGDEVIVPALTAAYTGLAVIASGATPVIVDVEPGTLTIDPQASAAAVTPRTRAIVPVHLYGQPANTPALKSVADRHALALVEDCCQSHLATQNGTPVGTLGTAGAFSFYPTKNLGALGDGGAVITNDAGLAARVRRLRNGGQTDRYHHSEPGVNSRLDELQAAIHRVRLVHLPGLTARRREFAALYRQLLPQFVTPIPEREPGHVYHLFPVRSVERDALQAHLGQSGVETLIHYPLPLAKQGAFSAFAPTDCPVASRAADELLSLPLHPRLTVANLMRIAEAVGAFQKGRVLA